MKINWKILRKEHVQKAIEKFLLNPSSYPKARTTFLKYKDKELPAKHILGMAYEIATGTFPSKDDYSGGDETEHILRNLGFEVVHKKRGQQSDTSNLKITSQPTQKAALSVTGQKNALQKLLQKRFGLIETEKRFKWLKTPDENHLPPEYKKIVSALAKHRGFKSFFKSNYYLLCDFYFQDYKLIIEYDENQHFTLPRKIALKNYPKNSAIYFSKSHWMESCLSIQAKDNAPYYRDEQRAFYDSVRDIEALKNGYILVRIKHGDYDWEAPEAESYLDQIFSGIPLKKVTDLTIGMVSFVVDFQNEESGKKNLSCVTRIINENENLDLILFSGWTIFDIEDLKQLRSQITNKKSLVLFEVWKDSFLGEPKHRGYFVSNGKIRDNGIYQVFATSHEISKNSSKMEEFLVEQFFHKRRFQIQNKILRWIICGEINLLKNNQNNKNEVKFRFSENSYLNQAFEKIFAETNIFVNPTHTEMGNQGKLERRRQFLSQNNRVFCSVSNLDLQKHKIQSSFNTLKRFDSLQYCFFNGEPVNGSVKEDSDRHLFKTYTIENFFLG